MNGAIIGGRVKHVPLDGATTNKAPDNARERRFGNGREPRVLWKIHAAFIAVLLQSGGGARGKTGILHGGVLCRPDARVVTRRTHAR